MDENFLNQKEQEFIDNGYVVFNNLYSLAEVQKMHNIVTSIIDETQNIEYLNKNKSHVINYNGSLLHLKFHQNQTIVHNISWIMGSKPEFSDFSRAPKLLTIVAKLLQSNQADHLINVVHPKLAHDNFTWGAHQDVSNRITADSTWKNLNKDRSYVVCITAIDPMKEENGGLFIVPNSHKGGNQLSKLELKQLDISEAYVPTLEAGDTMCMNQYLVHYSLKNKSNSSRIILLDGFSVVGANSKPYFGEGSASTIELLSGENNSDFL